MFAIINIVFFWHTVVFFFGNHDWGHIKNGFGIGWSVFDGRWGAGLIQQAVGGDILPVLNNLFCFAGFCLAMIALAKYWELPKNTLIYTIFGLFIMLLPYTYPWLQFVSSETYFWNILLIVWASISADKKRLFPQIAAFVIFVFSLGCYPATIEAIVVIFLGRCLLTVWFDNPSLKDFIKKYWLHAFNIFFSFIIFTVLFEWMKKRGLFINYSSVEPVTFAVLLQNFIKLPHALWDTFISDSSYMPTWFKLWLETSALFIIALMLKKSWRQNLLTVLLVATLLIASQICELLSTYYYAAQMRIDFFAVPYILALGWTVLLRQKENFWKNIALIMMLFAVYYSGLQAFRDQKVKYFDKQYEMKVFDDIRARIKANPNFSPNKQYNIVMIGCLLKPEERTPFDRYHQHIKIENTWVSFVPEWNAKEFFDFYEKDSFVRMSYPDINYLLSDDSLHRLDINYLLNSAHPWPHPNSVYIDRHNIYIILDQEKLDILKERIRATMLH